MKPKELQKKRSKLCLKLIQILYLSTENETSQIAFINSKGFNGSKQVSFCVSATVRYQALVINFLASDILSHVLLRWYLTIHVWCQVRKNISYTAILGGARYSDLVVSLLSSGWGGVLPYMGYIAGRNMSIIENVVDKSIILDICW